MKGYVYMRKMCAQQGVGIDHLLVMAEQNDPFYAGAPAQRRDADWFAKLMDALKVPHGWHTRRIHYRLISLPEPVLLPGGAPYENTAKCWAILNKASKFARHLGLVEPDQFSDHRTPDPLLYADYPTRDAEVGYEIIDESSLWNLPRLTMQDIFISEACLDLPRIVVSGYEYSLQDQPYHLEVWIEKSTMNDVLIPICERFGVNLITGIGHQSITSVINLLKRLGHLPDQKPSRVFYISDHDSAGDSMPIMVSRHIEYYRDQFAPGKEVMLTPLALTKAQVEQYQLPFVPAKEQDRSAPSFLSRRGVPGMTELDALEAVVPGELARLLTAAIAPYRDNDIRNELRRAENDAQEDADRQFDSALGESRDRIEQLQEQASEIVREFAPQVKELNDRFRTEQKKLNDEFLKKMQPLEAVLEASRHAIAECVTGLAIDLPCRPEACGNVEDESDFLFDSSRDYMTQLEAYKRHQNKSTVEDLVKTCKMCGGPLSTTRANAFLCSTKCRANHSRSQRQERKRKK
jgi:hypothetical protein